MEVGSKTRRAPDINVPEKSRCHDSSNVILLASTPSTESSAPFTSHLPDENTFLFILALQKRSFNVANLADLPREQGLHGSFNAGCSIYPLSEALACHYPLLLCLLMSMR